MSEVTGDLQTLVDTIEAGHTVELSFPTYAYGLRMLASIRSKLYRERNKLSTIVDTDFEPFSFKWSREFPDDGRYILTLKLAPVTKPMYAWKVVDNE